MNKLVRVIDVLRIKRECAKRSSHCDKDCDSCDLHLSIDETVNALNTAIAFLDAQRNIDELMKGE